MKTKFAFLLLNLIIASSWAQTQIMVQEPNTGNNKIYNLDGNNTIITNGDQKFVVNNNLANDSGSIKDTSGIKSYIVQFKGEPLIKYKAGKGSLKSAIIDKEKIFDTFLNDLGNIIKSNKGNLKSVTIATPAIKNKYTKAFYGASFSINSELIKEVSKLVYVKAIYENKKVEAFDEGPAVQVIHADSVWIKMGNKGDSVKVGIIDTGIDYMHPALGGGFGNDYKVKGGYDFVNKDTIPMDDNGHGTHVAGIVAGENDSITGVAPNAFLYAYKVLNYSGSGSVDDVIAAIEKCVDPNNDDNFDDKMDVVNMSLGSKDGSPNAPDDIAVNNASDAGVVFCIAAGNSGLSGKTIGSPGSAESAITVGAIDNDGKIAYFSSTGPNQETYDIKPEVVAPGVNILSPVLNGNYEKHSGTSMATPHVAGTCALMKKQHPQWGPKEMKSALMSTAHDIGEHVMVQGAGSVDAYKACKTTTVTYPATLNYGNINALDSIWSKTLNIKVCNQDIVAHTYTFSWKMQLSGMSLKTDTDSITINSMDTAEIEVTLKIENSIVPLSKGKYINYYGNLYIHNQADSFNIPLTVIKSKKIVIHFFPNNQLSATFFFFKNQVEYFIKGYYGAPTTPDNLELLIPDSSYWYIGYVQLYDSIAKTSRYNYYYKYVEVPKLIDTLDLTKTLFKNHVKIQLLDETGNKIDMNKTYMGLLMCDNVSFSSNAIEEEFRIADCDFNTYLMVGGCYTNNDKSKSYTGSFKLKSIHSDTIIENNPENYKKINLWLNTPIYKSYMFGLALNHMGRGWIVWTNTELMPVYDEYPYIGELFLADNTNDSLYFTIGLSRETDLFPPLSYPIFY